MIREYEEGPEGIEKVVTSGLDGRLVIWDVGSSALRARMGGMSIRR
jgi:hypothetical protein